MHARKIPGIPVSISAEKSLSLILSAFQNIRPSYWEGNRMQLILIYTVGLHLEKYR